MRPARARRRRRPRVALWLALAAAGVLVFGLGVALGEALQDTPPPGGKRTLVRTLHPFTLAPATTETVTVTASS